MTIERVIARQILDSRGVPTVEAEVWLEGGIFGRSAVPSGASTGIHEALELRDGEKAFNGKSVMKAVCNVKDVISPALRGMSADDQYEIDKKMIELDATENKSKLGANAILAVSLAAAHAAAKQRGLVLYAHINDIAGNPKKSLPMPMMNVLNGGKHATNSSDFQEFMIVPVGAQTYQECIQIGAEVFHALKKEIADAGQSTAVGDEGGFTYPVTSNEQMLNLLVKACSTAGYKLGSDVSFATDIAASEFYQEDGGYFLAAENKAYTTQEFIEYLKHLAETYPLISIEDGLAQDDWNGWQILHQVLGYTQLVGDDLLVTNINRVAKAIELNACNSVLIKPNQIGTLSETIDVIKKAKEHGWKTIVSHRSGETEDVTIAHIAVGTGAGQIKTGSLSRSDRNAKHNELLRIESIDDTLTLDNPFK